MAIASARHTVDITSPYFVIDESSDWAFRDAVARGVKVRILVEGDITDAMAVKYASRQAYDHLLALGIEIYEYQPTMMHTKTFVVDGTWSMFGSANFDNRSLELNDELNVAVSSRPLAARFLEDFDNDLRSVVTPRPAAVAPPINAREVPRAVLVCTSERYSDSSQTSALSCQLISRANDEHRRPHVIAADCQTALAESQELGDW